MNPSTYILLILPIIISLITSSRNRKAVIAGKIIEKRKTEGNTEMIELAKKFIGKDCIIYSYDSSHQYQGTIKEVSDSAILIEEKGVTEVLNLDFIIRIREYPKNKNGKRKAFYA